MSLSGIEMPELSSPLATNDDPSNKGLLVTHLSLRTGPLQCLRLQSLSAILLVE